MIRTGETLQPGCDLSDPGPTKYNIISPTLHWAATHPARDKLGKIYKISPKYNIISPTLHWATHPARKNLGKFTKCNWRFSSPKLN